MKPSPLARDLCAQLIADAIDKRGAPGISPEEIIEKAVVIGIAFRAGMQAFDGEAEEKDGLPPLTFTPKAIKPTPESAPADLPVIELVELMGVDGLPCRRLEVSRLHGKSLPVEFPQDFDPQLLHGQTFEQILALCASVARTAHRLASAPP